MEVSNLGSFSAAQKQTTEKNEVGKDSPNLTSVESQGTATVAAQPRPIPPVNQTTELSSEEGNITNLGSETSRAVDILA